MQASDRVTYGGHPIDRLTAERLKSMDMMLASPHFGGEKEHMTSLQGIGGYAKSGGTHVSGACEDVTEFNWRNRQLVGRLTGGADYHRPYNWDNAGGGPHCHLNTIGVGYASNSAKAQWVAYYAGKNALRNNAKDTGPRLATKPLFVAPWTDRGERGTFYLNTACTGRSEGSVHAASRGAIAKGTKFAVVAVVNVDGVLWAISPDGVHVPKSALSKTKSVTSAPPPVTYIDFDAYWVVTATKWGLTAPVGGKNRYERKPGYQLHTVKKAMQGSKLLGYVTSSETFYSPQDLDPAVQPEEPATPTATSFVLPSGQLNVCRNRITTTGKDWTSPGGFHVKDVSKGLGWSARVKLLGALCVKAKISDLSTQETAQYVDRDAIIKSLGGGWTGVLHGDGDLSNALFADTGIFVKISDGSFATAGPHHNECTWVIWRHKPTGIEFVRSTSHLIDPAQGSDTLRGQQAVVWIKGTEKVAGGRPIIFSGDVNIVRSSSDPVGKAFAAHYDEAEVVATAKIHNDWSTTNQLKTTPHTGRRVDRVWGTKGKVKFISIETFWGAPGTDHNLVVTKSEISA